MSGRTDLLRVTTVWFTDAGDFSLRQAGGNYCHNVVLDATRLLPNGIFKKRSGSFDRSFDGVDIDRRCKSIVKHC